MAIYDISFLNTSGYIVKNLTYSSGITNYINLIDPPPSVPVLTMWSNNVNRAVLSWGASTSDNHTISGYEIWVSRGSGFTYETIVTGLTYTDTLSSVGSTYQYKIRSKDSTNEYSEFSNLTSIITVIAASSTLNQLTINVLPRNLDWNISVAGGIGTYTFYVTNITRSSGAKTISILHSGTEGDYNGTVDMGFGITNTTGDTFSLTSGNGIPVYIDGLQILPFISS